MNILFVTISSFNSIYERGIYTDLIRKFINEGHSMYVVQPVERRYKKSTRLLTEDNCHILYVRTLNIQKTNLLEKGIALFLVENQFQKAIKKYYSHITFDLILYSTPPISYTKIVKFIKNRDNAKSYLLLKDIFPQNAIDLGFIRENGPLHKIYKHKEVELYSISDKIGCMSPANIEFLSNKNPWLDKSKLEVNPNSIELIEIKKDKTFGNSIRAKYNIPLSSTLLIYGGNLGKPQGINFLIKVLDENKAKSNLFFVIVGSGTEYNRLDKWLKLNHQVNAVLLPNLPKNEYEILLSAADIGLIFLDPRFTIPNFPSRLLSYLEYSMPIIAATDLNTDLGRIAEKNEFGLSCLNGDIITMNKHINILSENPEKRESMGKNGLKFLNENYSVNVSYSLIINSIK